MKKIILSFLMILAITTVIGCGKNKKTSNEEATLPSMETISEITAKETTVPTASTVDVLKEAPSAFEDIPEETTRPAETTPPTTEGSEPIETSSLVSPENIGGETDEVFE